jgi:hypothetical protein
MPPVTSRGIWPARLALMGKADWTRWQSAISASTVDVIERSTPIEAVGELLQAHTDR